MPTLQGRILQNVNYKIIALIVASVILLSTITAYCVTVYSYKNIYPDVSICNVSVGKMSKEQAVDTVTKNFADTFYSKTIKVEYKGKVKEIELSDKYNVDIEKTVEKAFSVGRSGGIFKRSNAMNKKVNIPLVLNEQPDEKAKMDAELLLFAQEFEEDHSFFEIAPDYKSISVDLTKDAVLLDIAETEKKIYDNISNAIFDTVAFVVKNELTSDDVDLIYSRLERPAIDASIEVVNEKNSVVKPHQLGIVVDKSMLAEKLKNKQKAFSIPITTIMPKITTEHFAIKMYTDVLGEQVTSYNAGLIGRTKNVTLAAGYINGTIIAPGKDFSFNRVVGKRSYERGFMDGVVFSNGRAEDGVGGGICQVSSTLYSAQLYADLETISRKNHQFMVSYMPAGQDATVAYGYIDYVFRNNTQYPIKITTQASGGKLIIKILGTKTDKDKKITIVNQTIETSPFETKTEFASNLSTGETQVKQKGQNGATVDTYKVYWKNGIEQKREMIHRSVYQPMERLVLQGSGAAPAPSAMPAEPPSVSNDPIPQQTKNPLPSQKPVATAAPSEIPDPSDTPAQTDKPTIPTSDTGI